MKRESGAKQGLKKGKVSVLVAKSEPLAREVLVSLLRDEGFDVVGRAGRLDELIARMRADAPAWVVTEAALIGDPAPLLGALAKMKPSPGVVVYVRPEADDVHSVLEAGFSAYLHGSDRLVELFRCLRPAGGLEPYYSPRLREMARELGVTGLSARSQSAA